MSFAVECGRFGSCAIDQAVEQHRVAAHPRVLDLDQLGRRANSGFDPEVRSTLLHRRRHRVEQMHLEVDGLGPNVGLFVSCARRVELHVDTQRGLEVRLLNDHLRHDHRREHTACTGELVDGQAVRFEHGVGLGCAGRW